MWVIVGPEREGIFVSAGQVHYNSQMAYTLRPDQVHEVCQRDRSIATARRLEHLCEVPEKTQPEEWSIPRCGAGWARDART